MKKRTPAPGTRTGLRSQSKQVALNSGPPDPAEAAPIAPVPLLLPQPPQVQPEQPDYSDVEVEDQGEPRPAEQPLTETDLEQVDIQEIPPSKHRLTARNLRRHDGVQRPPRGVKRPYADGPATTEGTSSARSSSRHTAVLYRRQNLRAVNVEIHTTPPDQVRKAIDAVFRPRPPSAQRRANIESISRTFREGCIEAAEGQFNKTNFINCCDRAVSDLDYDDVYSLRRDEWRGDLKPLDPPPDGPIPFALPQVGPGFTAGGEPEVDTASPRAGKRRQQYLPGSAANTDPEQPRTTPSAEEERGNNLTATPRPDMTLGIKMSTIGRAIWSDKYKPQDPRAIWWLLTELEKEQVRRGPDGHLESALLAMPSRDGRTDLTFPFAVVEGKSYAAGHQISEAENQAAVSGACALKIQLCLDELVDRVTGKRQTSPVALFFSITTQGPIHELWAHYTVVKFDRREFCSTLLKSCNAVLLDSLQPFMIAVDRVCAWGCGPFLDSVAERLGRVAKWKEEHRHPQD